MPRSKSSSQEMRQYRLSGVDRPRPIGAVEKIEAAFHAASLACLENKDYWKGVATEKEKKEVAVWRFRVESYFSAGREDQAIDLAREAVHHAQTNSLMEREAGAAWDGMVRKVLFKDASRALSHAQRFYQLAECWQPNRPGRDMETEIRARHPGVKAIKPFAVCLKSQDMPELF